ITVLEAALALQKVKPGSEHPNTLHTMYSIGNNYGKLDRYADALKWHEDALKLRRTVLGADSRDTLYSMWGVAANLLKLKRGPEAIPIIDECLDRAAKDPVANFADLADLRLDYFAQAGDAKGCKATAELWEKMKRTDSASLYNAARYRAVTAIVLR